MTENNEQAQLENSENDLSEGNISQGNIKISEAMLSDAREKVAFQKKSFIFAWFFSGLFFISVIAFSWAAVFCPEISPFKTVSHAKSESIADSEAKENSKVLSTSKIPTEDKALSKKNDEGDSLSDLNIPNQFLILLALLSAVGTTLSIAVMRFSFSVEKSENKAKEATLVSPVANAFIELVDLIKDIFYKKDKD